MTDLINFIIVTCKIWQKIGLGHETLMAETETRRWYVSRPSRDRDVETETTTLLTYLLTCGFVAPAVQQIHSAFTTDRGK